MGYEALRDDRRRRRRRGRRSPRPLSLLYAASAGRETLPLDSLHGNAEASLCMQRYGMSITTRCPWAQPAKTPQKSMAEMREARAFMVQHLAVPSLKSVAAGAARRKEGAIRHPLACTTSGCRSVEGGSLPCSSAGYIVRDAGWSRGRQRVRGTEPPVRIAARIMPARLPAVIRPVANDAPARIRLRLPAGLRPSCRPVPAIP